ncbi:penicillin-binding protein [Sporosarcina sp. NCCP-2222]|uniref:peptidoglycan D,D-transpeptidase FtsI family protein n=1 Tax=Sporosarcina sp. NCCP-2222 TaxID=2935073 RepID=UPI002082ECE6|nr:penicillin-binding protein 2 [Sporosarcina sp. NCCP-2222]GKV57555.1 penicillin-binding protein [Sporosarcina sp. NCCP-2222]
MRKQISQADKVRLRQRKHIAFRMNLLFFCIFFLFSLLIFRLGYLQIVKGKEYTLQLELKEEIPVNTSVPRGRIYDRNGNVLVDNEPKNAITYTKTTSTTSKDMLKIARDLAQLIEQDTKRITLGDKRDFWILLNSKKAEKKVTAEEIEALRKKHDTWTEKEIQKEINQMTRDRITDKEINSFTKKDLEVLAIYREMMSGYAYSPQIIKSDNVTEIEFARVSERLNDLPGVDTTTDWDRIKVSDNTLIGSTTTSLQGIPRTRLDYFLARDYSRNDRVGISYLEQSYEELLKGQKTVVKNVKDRTGRVVETVTVREGEPGKDLVLTLDSELHEALEQIVSDKLLAWKQVRTSGLLDRAFLVMMNPNNGEVLALIGKQLVQDKDTGKWIVQDYAFGTFTSAYEVGSTVKLATVLTGYSENVLRIGEVKIDEPIYIAGSSVKQSLFNRGGNRVAINEIEALGKSSNVYMFKIAMSLGDAVYRPYKPLPINLEGFDRFRESFASFGLGVKTGIDLPGEYPGYPGTETISGKLLDFSIGQFDTYTPLQMAQYVSTVANGGYRMAPRIVKEIREPSPDGSVFGALMQETEAVVLNRVKNTDEEIEQVKKGMLYTYGPRGTAPNLFANAKYTAAGKTGTAQSAYYDGSDRSKYGTKTVNLTHVGFAPFETPEVAFSIVIPNVSTDRNDYTSKWSNDLAREALDIYFDLKKRRMMEEQPVTTDLPIRRKLEQEGDKN